MQFLLEEAAATALELYEAELNADAVDKNAHPGESDVRARHRRLLAEAEEG
jgi:hypothetical protein